MSRRASKYNNDCKVTDKEIKDFQVANPNITQTKIANHFKVSPQLISKRLQRISAREELTFETLKEQMFLNNNKHEYLKKMHRLTDEHEIVKCPECKHAFKYWRGNFYAIKEMNILAGNYNINKSNDKDNGQQQQVAIIIRKDFDNINNNNDLEVRPGQLNNDAKRLNDDEHEVRKSELGG